MSQESEEDPPTPILENLPGPPNAAGLDLEDEILTFTANAYRRENRRAKLDNLKARAADGTCERIRRAEIEHGSEMFRSALLRYLADQSDWLREHRWPIRTFLSQIERYLPDTPQEPQRCAPERASAIDAPRVVPTAHPTPSHDPVLPYAAQEWNRVVTAGPPVEQWTQRDRGLAVNDPDFMAALPKVLQLCQQAFETQPGEVDWLNFRYLLRKGKGCDVENWYRMANGEFNWLRKKRDAAGGKGKSAGETAMEQYMASLDAQIAADKEGQK